MCPSPQAQVPDLNLTSHSTLLSTHLTTKKKNILVPGTAVTECSQAQSRFISRISNEGWTTKFSVWPATLSPVKCWAHHPKTTHTRKQKSRDLSKSNYGINCKETTNNEKCIHRLPIQSGTLWLNNATLVHWKKNKLQQSPIMYIIIHVVVTSGFVANTKTTLRKRDSNLKMSGKYTRHFMSVKHSGSHVSPLQGTV